MSNRDKKLLVYLGTVIILAAAYYLVVSPVLSKIEVMNNHITELEEQLNKLQTIYNSREQYEADIVENQEICNELIAKFPSTITQEDTLVFLDNTEKEVPVTISSVNFGEIVTAFGTEASGDAVYEDSPDEEYSEEKVETDRIETNEDGSKVISFEDLTRLIGIKQDLTISFAAKYGDFAKFIEYIDANEKRMVLTSFSASYDESSDIVSGSANLSHYAVENYGKDREPNDFSDINKGSRNIFYSGYVGSDSNSMASEDSSDLTVSASDSNLTMIVNKVNDNGGAVIIADSNSTSKDSWATANDNKKVTANITVEGEAGEYTAKYSVAGKENKFEFEEDSEIILNIVSSAIDGDDDSVKVDLNLTNDADLDLVVNIKSDPDERISIKSRKANDGKITVNK